LDILIHERDFERMYDILIKNGYVPEYSVNSRTRKKLATIRKDLRFSGHGLILEVHWKITERRLSIPLSMGEFWKRSDRIQLNDRLLGTLLPEDSVILLCIHGTKHFWNEIKWLADLIHIIENHPNLKWQQIFSQAEKVGMRKILILGLFLAQEYGGNNFFREGKNLFVSDSHLHHHTNSIKNNFFCQTDRVIFFTPPIFYLQRRERIIDSVKFGFFFFTDNVLMPNERDFKIISLPESLFPLYLFIRQFRIIFEYGPKFIEILKCNKN